MPRIWTWGHLGVHFIGLIQVMTVTVVAATSLNAHIVLVAGMLICELIVMAMRVRTLLRYGIAISAHEIRIPRLLGFGTHHLRHVEAISIELGLNGARFVSFRDRRIWRPVAVGAGGPSMVTSGAGVSGAVVLSSSDKWLADLVRECREFGYRVTPSERVLSKFPFLDA